MKRVLLIGLVWVLPSLQASQAAGERKPYYGVQVKALPVAEQSQGLALYETLKSKGYLVYYYSAQVKGQEVLKLRVGDFAEKVAAQKLGETLKQQEGLEVVVDKMPLVVDDYQHQFAIVTTPSGIWYQAPEVVRELYRFKKVNSVQVLEESFAQLSPTGKEVVFYEEGQLLKVDVKTAKSQVLVKEGLVNSRPAWSYDGKYIAYLDDSEWEMTTSLCLVAADGVKTTCLIQNSPTTQRAVKSFRWHPAQLQLFFVEGYAYGTETVGGNLYRVDLAGQRKEVATVGGAKNQEIKAEFTLQGGEITYQVVQFDENSKVKLVATKKIKVDD